MKFWKGHALANDYIVIEGGAEDPDPGLIRAICDRHRGVGSDGVLWGDVADFPSSPAGLRIFNPDGGEAEKSGNGLRIFGAWLHAYRDAPDSFEVALPGETVRMAVESVADDGSRVIRVAMGRASFRAGDVGFTDAGADDEVLGRPLRVGDEEVDVHLVSMGNPHCVVLEAELDEERFRRLGPLLEAHPSFERGTNVQFARVAPGGEIELRIWERGAGETMASGSSSCAAVAVARKVGRIEGDRVTVRMPGGEVEVRIDSDWRVELTGPAIIVFAGEVEGSVIESWKTG